MRIAIVIWQLDTYGGSIRQALELAHHLSQQKHDVEVITYSLNKERCFPELIKKLKVFTAKQIDAQQVFYNPSSNILIRIKGFIQNLYIRQLQVNSLAKTLATRHAKKPFAVINYHDNGVMSIAREFSDVKNIWMLNDPPSFVDTREKKASAFSDSFLLLFLATLQSLFTQFQLRHIDKIVVLDKRNQAIVRKYFHTTSKIIRSGLSIPSSLKKFRPKKNRRIVQILSTNIFFRHRRYEDLINALAIIVNTMKIKNIRLRIVGDPESDIGYYNMIRELATKKKVLSYIDFLGRVDEKTLFAEYENADIFVFPNHNQTWGLSVFEAMAHCCACVVSTGCGAHEVLTDKENTLLFESKNAKMLASKLAYFIKNPKKRREISKAGHAFVVQNISWQKYSKDMLTLFKNA